MEMCPVLKLHFLVCLFHGDVPCSKVTLLSVSVSWICALFKVTLLSVYVRSVTLEQAHLHETYTLRSVTLEQGTYP